MLEFNIQLSWNNTENLVSRTIRISQIEFMNKFDLNQINFGGVNFPSSALKLFGGSSLIFLSQFHFYCNIS